MRLFLPQTCEGKTNLRSGMAPTSFTFSVRPVQRSNWHQLPTPARRCNPPERDVKFGPKVSPREHKGWLRREMKHCEGPTSKLGLRNRIHWDGALRWRGYSIISWESEPRKLITRAEPTLATKKRRTRETHAAFVRKLLQATRGSTKRLAARHDAVWNERGPQHHIVLRWTSVSDTRQPGPQDRSSLLEERPPQVQVLLGEDQWRKV